ncbi:MAG: hypothetical protein JXI43_06465 [Tissierellales bacterium]|nr:hypothetical protein [Tissierellales bacterium]
MNSSDKFIREEKNLNGDRLAKLFELLDRWDKSLDVENDKRFDTSHTKAGGETAFSVLREKGAGKMRGKRDE